MARSPSGKTVRGRRGRGCLAAFVVLCLALLIAPAARLALLTPHKPSSVIVPFKQATKARYTVGVLIYRFHSAILIEQAAGEALGPPDREKARFLEYGWGDRQFYGFNNHGIGAILVATFWGTPSVTYLEGWGQMPQSQRGIDAIYTREVTPQQRETLIRSCEDSMDRTPDGQRVAPYLARDNRGRFYPSWQNYIWWADCNRWTLDRLSAAGLSESGAGVIAVQQVPARLKGFQRVQ